MSDHVPQPDVARMAKYRYSRRLAIDISEPEFIVALQGEGLDIVNAVPLVERAAAIKSEDELYGNGYLRLRGRARARANPRTPSSRNHRAGPVGLFCPLRTRATNGRTCRLPQSGTGRSSGMGCLKMLSTFPFETDLLL